MPALLGACGSAPNHFCAPRRGAAVLQAVGTLGYGDGGPWYIPTREAYTQGGYEPTVAWCDPEVDSLLSDGIAKLCGDALLN